MSHIFISYSRKDIDFAQKIVNALAENDLDTWIDWKSIPKGEDWEQEIYHGIEGADAFLFLVSPDSVTSGMCNKEISHAVANSKRILPIVIRDADIENFLLKDAKEVISKRNWIFCRYKKEQPDTIVVLDDFKKAIEDIQTTIHTDYEWLKYHTRLQVKVLEWERQEDKEDTSKLLRGKELQEAEQKLASAGSRKDPQPTEPQRQYIANSREVENAEQKRLAEESEKTRARFRNLGIIIGIITICGAITAILAVWFGSQVGISSIRVGLANATATVARGREEEQAATAVSAQKIAVQEANIARAGELAATAITLNDLPLLSLLSLEAFKANDKWQTRNAIYIANHNNPNLLQHIHGNFYPTSISYSPDGMLLASPSINDTVLFIDVDPSSTTYGHTIGDTQKEHKDYISDIAFSPKGKLLASSSADNSIILWDVNMSSPTFGKPLIPPLVGHSDVVWEIAFSLDGKLLVSCSEDGSALIWDVDPESLTFGKVIAPRLIGHKDSVLVVAISSKNVIATGSEDLSIVFWDGDPSSSSFGYPISDRIQIHGGPLSVANSLSFSSDGNILASGGQEARIWLWDADPSSSSFGEIIKDPLIGELSVATRLKFNPINNILVSSHWDTSVRVWDISADSTDYGKTIDQTMQQNEEVVIAMDYSPDGNYLATSRLDGVIQIWSSVPTSQEIGVTLLSQPEAHSRHVRGLDFNSDGSLMASGSLDNTILIWDTALESKSFGEPVAPPFSASSEHASISDVEFSPDNKYLASANGTQFAIQIWNIDQTSSDFGTPVGDPFRGHEAQVWVVDYSPDGKIIASGGADATIILWDSEISSSQFGKPLISPLKGHSTSIEDLKFTPDGKFLASGGYDHTIRLWNVDPASPGFGESLCQPMETYNKLIHSIAISPDGKKLASTSGSEIILWDIDSASQGFCESIGSPFLGTIGFFSIAFSADGKNIISGDSGNSIVYWDADPQSPTFGDPIGPPLIAHNDNVNVIEIDPSGKILTSASDDGSMVFWRADIESWITNICQRSGRNLSKDEWNEYLTWKGPYDPEYKTCPQWPAGE